jgi:hypothetical protein
MAITELRPIGDCILRDFTSDKLAYCDPQMTEGRRRELVAGLVRRVLGYVEHTEPDGRKRLEKLDGVVHTLKEMDFPEAATEVARAAKWPLVTRVEEGLSKPVGDLIGSFLQPAEVALHMPSKIGNEAIALYTVFKKFIGHRDARIERFISGINTENFRLGMRRLRYELLNWCLGFDEATLVRMLKYLKVFDTSPYDREHVANLEFDLRVALRSKEGEADMCRFDYYATPCVGYLESPRNARMEPEELCCLYLLEYLPIISPNGMIDYQIMEVLEWLIKAGDIEFAMLVFEALDGLLSELGTRVFDGSLHRFYVDLAKQLPPAESERVLDRFEATMSNMIGSNQEFVYIELAKHYFYYARNEKKALASLEKVWCISGRSHGRFIRYVRENVPPQLLDKFLREYDSYYRFFKPKEAASAAAAPPK